MPPIRSRSHSLSSRVRKNALRKRFINCGNNIESKFHHDTEDPHYHRNVREYLSYYCCDIEELYPKIDNENTTTTVDEMQKSLIEIDNSEVPLHVDSVDGSCSEALSACNKKENVKKILKGIIEMVFRYPCTHPEKITQVLEKVSLGPENNNNSKVNEDEKHKNIMNTIAEENRNLAFLQPLFHYLHTMVKKRFKGKNFELYTSLFLKLCKLVEMFV